MRVLRLAAYRAVKPTRRAAPVLYRFDGGEEVSFAEAGHNVLILGGTGRGKTCGLVTPIMWRLVEAGLGGLVVDVKNTFTETLRRIAAACGREGDIVEIGTHPSAAPVNLLQGVQWLLLRQTLEDFVISRVENTNNVDWHLKGARQVADCAQLLCMLAAREPEFTPSFVLLDRMINDYEFARNVMAYWRANRYARGDLDQDAFESRIRNDANHVLMPKVGRDWDQQVTWQLQAARRSLAELAGGVLARNLSCGDGLDLARLLFDERKILVVRFSASTGGPGDLVGRMVKQRFYAAVYGRYDLRRPCDSDSPVFSILDEFQDILELQENATLNDFSWFSKAREFKVINIAATQSMSSLFRKGQEHRVRAMLANFSVKIILQSDDPETVKWIGGIAGFRINVAGLRKGAALLIKFAMPERELVLDLVRIQATHDDTQAKLTALPPCDAEPSAHPIDDLGARLATLAEKVRPAAGKEKTMEAPVDMPRWLLGENEVFRSIYHRHPEAFDPRFKTDLSALPGHVALLEDIAPMALSLGLRLIRLRTGNNSGEVFAVVAGADNKTRITFIRYVRRTSRQICPRCGHRGRLIRCRNKDALRQTEEMRLCRACLVSFSDRYERVKSKRTEPDDPPQAQLFPEDGSDEEDR